MNAKDTYRKAYHNLRCKSFGDRYNYTTEERLHIATRSLIDQARLAVIANRIEQTYCSYIVIRDSVSGDVKLLGGSHIVDRSRWELCGAGYGTRQEALRFLDDCRSERQVQS